MASGQDSAHKKQQELQMQYTNYKNTLQSLAQKVGEIEQEIEEHKCVPRPYTETHGGVDTRRCPDLPPLRGTWRTDCGCRLVIETLQPLPEDRKCFRLINGVLVERTVKDVLPALKTNSDGLKQVLEELVKQYKAKQDEMDKWKRKNHIQVVANQ
ncbi:Cochaperone prefoldin complex subunit [Exophiala dermatitidis]|nr:Cochaperone prefoldin complex subunit [Exophiala dermatitidis]KAJ4614509.1 Cochaperone prefoldin complex subunit [Exophiala dermatitidis]